MRGSDLLVSGLAFAATAIATPRGLCNRAACNADNCARLVTGTRAGLPSTRMADCSSFMVATVTPATIYITSTVTPTVSQDVTAVETVTAYSTVVQSTISIQRTTSPGQNSAAFAPRAPVSGISSQGAATSNAPTTATPTAIPQYAVSSCSAASRYSSACSCAGITRSTTTLATPTSQTTVTASPVTVTNTVAATTTVQQTVTATEVGSIKQGYTCGSSVPGNGIYSFRSYRVKCGQRVTSGNVAYVSNQSSEPSCLRICNSIRYCVYAEYQFSTGTCNLYYSTPQAVVDDGDWDALILM